MAGEAGVGGVPNAHNAMHHSGCHPVALISAFGMYSVHAVLRSLQKSMQR